MVRFAPCALLVAAVSGKPTPLPSFNWDTLPVFAETSNVTGPFDDDALDTLARFNLVVTEKAYDFPSPRPAEEKLLDLLTQLRSRASAAAKNLTAIFYYNSNLDLPDFGLNALTRAHAPDWWMQDDGGSAVWAHVDGGAGAQPSFPYERLRIFNHSIEAVRDAWVSECVNMTQRGFDGCFVDRFTRTPKVEGVSKQRMEQWAADRDLATAALTDLARESGFWLVSGGKASDSTSARALPGFGNKLDIDSMFHAAELGQGFLAARSTDPSKDVETQIAAFLIAASTNHFFGAGRWTVNHTSRAGLEWLPEYERPLGPPLGNATLEGGIYHRRFASGTNVTFDAHARVGHIAWAGSRSVVV